MKMGPICCPETSERNYHNWLRNNPEECSSLLHRGVSLQMMENIIRLSVSLFPATLKASRKAFRSLMSV